MDCRLGKTNKHLKKLKRYIYLISPQKIKGNRFYKELDRVLKSNKVKLEDLLSINENDYTYIWKSIYYLNLKYKINEIPISLPGRKLGYSKMRISHILSSLIILITFSIKEKIFKKFF